MGTRYQGFSSGDSLCPAAVRASTPSPARASAEGGAPPRLLLGLGLLAAVLALWAGPALAQSTLTFSATHTGTATVENGRVQLVEGGASTTFQIDLPANFLAAFKAAHPEAVRPGATFGAYLHIIRDSPDVTWDTTSGTTHRDRTAEYTISYNGTEIQPRYSVAFETLPERTWVFIPLTGTPPGSTSSFTDVDSFDAASFPITFTIQAESDTTYFENESIRVSGQFLLWGASATPSFPPIRYNSNDLTFDLVEAALPDPTGKPTTPANLTATAGKGAVTLIWDAIDHTTSNTNLFNDIQITKHQYCQKTDSSACADADWTDISNSAYGEVNDASYTIASLTDGTAYTFQVRAVNECATPAGCGIGDAAAAVTATPVADARTRPTGLTATAGNTQVTLTWTDPGDATITFYEYQQKAGFAPFGAWTPIPGSNAATTSYRLTGLDNGRVYGYRIRAGRGTDVSLASDTITVTPQKAPPAAPVLTAVPRNGGVTLSWPNPRDPTIQEYEYQYRIGAGAYAPWQTARQRTEEECNPPRSIDCAPPYFDTGNATLQFAVDGLSIGTPHTFRIQAVNADGKTISNEASTTPVVGVPAKPTGLTTGLHYVKPTWRRFLRWDRVADASILRYEFTVDAGRTWSFLQVYDAGAPFGYQRFDRDEYFPLEHIFRIRAVNAVGPGPASEPSVVEETETVAIARSASKIAVEWDSTSQEATLVWDATEHDDVRRWSVYFNRDIHGSTSDNWNTVLPVGTTRFEIPGTFNGGDDISVIVAGCLFSTNCLSGGLDYRTFQVGIPRQVSGFSATPGDAQITLAWDAPTDSSVTSFLYQVGDGTSPIVNIPDGDDADTDAGNETGYIVTGLDNGSFHSARLRAVNAHGAGPWTEWIRGVIPLAAGVPAAPSGLVTLGVGGGKSLTTWDDPQDPSITGYQQWDFSNRQWQDIPGSDATTTDAQDLLLSGTHVRLRAVNANGVGPNTLATFRHSPAPPRPTGLQAAPGNGRVALTWDDVGKGVYVESWRYSADGGETWNDIPDSGTTAQGQLTRYTVPNLANGQTYTFAILAENNRGIGPPSAAVTATPRAAAPAKPTGLVASPGDAEATLTWDNPRDAGITRYQVKQGAANWADITGSDAITTGHTVSSLTNGTTYTFQIRAVNDYNGDGTEDPGAASDAVTVTPGVPAAPASLSVAPGNAQATLTWTAPAETNGSAVTGYEYTSNADAATPAWADVPDGSDAGTERADETEYAVTGLDNNTAYAFAVRAENANGQGAATPSLRAVPVHPDAPQRPAGLRAILGHELVRLTWALPNVHHPVTSYQYRQSTNGGATWSPDWTAVTDSDADTTEHLLTGLANGTTYNFELRALNQDIAGPAATAQATLSPAAARMIINYETNRNDLASWQTTAEMTAPDGRTYTVTQFSPPAGLNWQIAVPGTTEIGGRAFTVRSLQGTTPYTSPQHTFTSTGQEGLDVVVHPPLAGPAQVCLEPSDLLRLEAGNRPLLVLRYSGASWTALPTTGDGDMLCGTTAGFSAFVLGYAAPASRPRPAPADNVAPQSVQAISPQTVPAGATSEPLDLTPYFHDPNGDSLTYAAVSDNAGVLIVDLPQGSSRLTLRGVAAGEAVVTVTARDPYGVSVSQRMTVTVRANTAPTVAQPFPAQVVAVGGTGRLPDLAPYFHDPDGDPLTYAAESNNPGAVMAEVPVGSSRLILSGVAAGEAVVVVTASDPHGGSVSQPLTVRTNTVPTVAERIPAQVVAAGGTGEPLDLTPYFDDPDGDPLTYAAVSDDPSVVTAEVPVGSSRLILSGAAAGEASVVVTASDPHGGSVSQTLGVRTNTAPTVVQPVPPLAAAIGGTGLRLDLAPYFDDPDGDPLAYAAVSDHPSVVSAEVPVGSSQLTLHGVAAGDAVVVVTASDPHGGSVTQTLTVKANAGPTVVQPIAPQVVAVGETSEPLDLAPYFHEPDDDPLTYAAVSYDTRVVTAEVPEGGSRLVLSGLAMGEAVVVVTASDPHGGSVTQPLTVRTNTAPTVVQPVPAQVVTVGGSGEPLDLAPYFDDPDGDPLTYAAESDNTRVVTAEVPAGSSQLTLHGVTAGETVVVVTASDPYGGSVSQTLTVKANAGPTVVQPIPPQVVAVGGTGEPLDLAPYFHDPDGDPLTYAAVSANPDVVMAEVPEDSHQLILHGVAAGETVVVVTASDPYGGSVSQPLNVRANTAPMVVQPLPAQVVAVGETSEPLDLAPYFDDPDGDPLTYAAASDNTRVVTAEVPAGSTQLILRGVAAGDAAVVVTASDPYGGSVSQTLTVKANAAPIVVQPIPPQVVAVGGTSEPLDLAPYFHDPDGDLLTYAAVSANPEVTTAAVAVDLFTLTGVAVGTAAVTVTARDPHGAAASQSVTVTVKVAEQAWVKAWVARFGRTVSGQVLDGVQDRLRVARQAGFEATLAGHRVGGIVEDEALERHYRNPGGAAALRRELGTLAGWMDEQMDHSTGGGTPWQALTGRDLLTSTAFTLTGGNADNGFGALWGRGVVSHFAGEDGALSLDGEVATGMLGADWVSGRWLTGLTLALSRGTGSYRAGDSSGEIESMLTGLYPWVGYHVSERLSVWTAAGYGTGVLTLTPPDHASMTTDVSLTLVAAGARSELLELPKLGGVLLALETDTRLTRTHTGATVGLDATDASVWQVRLGLEGSRRIALEGGGALRPSVELGLRHDGGDAETGSGIELGAGLSFAKPASGLSLDLAARRLLAHRASGLEEWGASASLTWDPTPSSDRGLSVSLQQSVGASSSGGVNALLARETMATPAAGAGINGAGRLQARAGYGLPLGEGRFIGTPQLGFGVSEGRHDYTLGWHLSVARREDLDLTVGIEASRRENPDASSPDHGVMLQVRLGH